MNEIFINWLCSEYGDILAEEIVSSEMLSDKSRANYSNFILNSN